MVSNSLTAAMDPTPTANPHAELVTEGFEECRPSETSARKWSSPMPLESKLVEGSERHGRQPATNHDTDHPREDDFADVWFEEGYKEGDMRENCRVSLPGLADNGGDIISQGQQMSIFEDTEKLKLARGCTLPSLKDLGLDIYIRRRIDGRFWG